MGVAIDIPFLLEALGDGAQAAAGVVLVPGALGDAEALGVADRLRAPGRPVVLLDDGRDEAEALAWARETGHAEVVLAVGPGRFVRVRVADGARREGDLASLASPLPA